MNPEQSTKRPLVIVDPSGRVVDVASMNRKGFAKSTERGELWCVHGETGRVLPYGDDFKLVDLVKEERWYRATVEASGERNISGVSANNASAAHGKAGGASAVEQSPFALGASDAESNAGSILGNLCEVIRRRRSERPEGSYTTYLFDSGEEKIRKKTAEEAIELVLARRREEVVSEAADLIYHLLVFLNQLDIPLDEVLGELAERA
jgi:phosphoribosyl-ATP pyrophosphohydrolase